MFVAEKIAGVHAEPVRYDAIPACTYCHPGDRVGRPDRGQGEGAEHPDQGRPVPVPPARHARWRPARPTGFIKVIWHAETGALVGAHLIGPAVTDLIAELTLAKTTEVNAESLIYTIHAHPTFAEAIKGATEDALGHAIDL